MPLVVSRGGGGGGGDSNEGDVVAIFVIVVVGGGGGGGDSDIGSDGLGSGWGIVVALVSGDCLPFLFCSFLFSRLVLTLTVIFRFVTVNNPYNNQLYLCVAMAKSVHLMQWYEPMERFMKVKASTAFRISNSCSFEALIALRIC